MWGLPSQCFYFIMLIGSALAIDELPESDVFYIGSKCCKMIFLDGELSLISNGQNTTHHLGIIKKKYCVISIFQFFFFYFKVLTLWRPGKSV